MRGRGVERKQTSVASTYPKLRREFGVTGSDPELARKLKLHIVAHVRVDAAHMRL